VCALGKDVNSTKDCAFLVAATCVGKDGKARFLDSYTGKLLARWNGTAFVNEMNR
jgi:hypothetical protein